MNKSFLFLLFTLLTFIDLSHGDCRCRFKKGTSAQQKLSALNYVCGIISCDPITPGGEAFYPDTIESHSSWAVNAYWKQFVWEPTSCDFGSTAALLCEDCKCLLNTKNETILKGIVGFVCNQPRFDCSAIKPGGEHFLPNTTYDHASWVVNEWYSEHVWAVESCDFGRNAYLSPDVCKDGPEVSKKL